MTILVLAWLVLGLAVSLAFGAVCAVGEGRADER